MQGTPGVRGSRPGCRSEGVGDHDRRGQVAAEPSGLTPSLAARAADVGRLASSLVRTNRKKAGRVRIQLNNVRYLGGHRDFDREKDGTVLVIDDAGIHLRTITEKFVVPWPAVANVIVEGPDQAQKRLTATRLVTLGVFAFGAKKNTTETYMQVETTDGQAIGFLARKTAAGELRAKLAPWVNRRTAQHGGAEPVPVVSPAAPSAAGLAEQLRELASLRDSGALSDEEFRAAKARLLDRT